MVTDIAKALPQFSRDDLRALRSITADLAELLESA